MQHSAELLLSVVAAAAAAAGGGKMEASGIFMCVRSDEDGNRFLASLPANACYVTTCRRGGASYIRDSVINRTDLCGGQAIERYRVFTRSSIHRAGSCRPIGTPPFGSNVGLGLGF